MACKAPSRERGGLNENEEEERFLVSLTVGRSPIQLVTCFEVGGQIGLHAVTFAQTDTNLFLLHSVQFKRLGNHIHNGDGAI